MKRSAATAAAAPTKRTRIADDDDDDPALEPTSHRRNRVRTDGYDSDSTDDGEGVVESRKHDDDHMFAAVAPKHEYLRLADIEGQEFSHSEQESEPEDEDDAGRRRKAAMGYEMSSFNMRDEMEEGKFTEDGNYVRTLDVHAVHDRWMDGFSERDITLARRSKRRHDKAQRDKIQAEEKELQESGGTANLEKELLALLKKGETVLEALQRLGAQPKRNPRPEIEKITHLASNIMALGETDIYSKSYEQLVRAVRSSASVDDSWVPPSADLRYEYKWDIPSGPQPHQTFGPFSEQEMKAWMKASYFGVAGEKVKVRVLGDPEWRDWDEVAI